MSIQSNFYKVTNQIMLEYRSDQFKILNSDMSVDVQPERCYIYRGLDDCLYYTEDLRYKDTKSADYYKNQALYLKFPDENQSTYTHLGSDFNVGYMMDWENNPHIKHSLWLSKEKDQLTDIQLSKLNIHYDTIRIYFLRGFTVSSSVGLDGISIKVKTKGLREVIDKDRRYKVEDELCVLDFYLSSIMFVKAVRRMSTPLYMNSKFYDQYIDVEFPAPYGIALSDNSSDINSSDFLFWSFDESDPDNPRYDVHTVNLNANTLIEFATISSGNTKQAENTGLYSASRVDAITFTLDAIDTASYMPESNTNFFNAKIYEDSVNKCIVYYPTYGDIDNQQEIDTIIMSRINSGEIPVTANAFYDIENADLAVNDISFAEDELYYYEESQKIEPKWKVCNDIIVAYLYGGVTGNEYAYNETYSRIVDYTNNIDSSIQFWRTQFVPNANIISVLGVRDIAIKYTCRIVNSMRGIEVIRVASLTVDARKYTENITNTLNIKQYKIVNKIVNTSPGVIQQQEVIKEKFIRSYYNASQLVAKNVGTGGTVYPQGQMTLKLYRTNNNYLVQLFNMNDSNVRIPYDMTGPYKYRIVFPLNDGSKLSISTNSDSNKQNLGIGTLVFYITGDQAVQIMNVPDADRYFAIMTDTGSSAAQDTTLYQGKVEWL